MMRKTHFVVLFAALALMLAGCGGDGDNQGQARTSSDHTAMTQAGQSGDLVAKDLQGDTHNLNKWLGKQPTVVNFWGTWCPPCRMEIPHMVEVYNEYKDDGIEMLSLAVERGSTDKVAPFADEHNMNWVMLVGNQQLMQHFNATRGIPTTIFFDAEGNEVERFVGARGYDDFKQAFEKALQS
jgi:thiol-disulfide isomerase/thioredoxin